MGLMNKNQKGVALIEALVAAVIVGIGFVAVFGTFIEALLSNAEVILGFGELFKMFKKLGKTSEKITKISKTPEIGSRFVRVKC